MNIHWSMNMLCDRNISEFEFGRDTHGSEYAWVLLNNASICLLMPETERK